MDQRNAGRSRTAIEADHGRHTYAADHLALMDHLGFWRFHALGGCIGGNFYLKLCEIAPDRITAAVLQNPIGLHPDHPEYFPESFAEWAAEMKAERPHLDDAKIAAFGKSMWDGEFVYSVSRDFCRRCTVPTFLLPGTDKPHPAVTSDELKQLLPGLEVLENWRGRNTWMNSCDACWRSSVGTRRRKHARQHNGGRIWPSSSARASIATR